MTCAMPLSRGECAKSRELRIAQFNLVANAFHELFELLE